MPEVDEYEAAREDGVEEQCAQGKRRDAYQRCAGDDANMLEPGRAPGERIETAHLECDEGERDVCEDVGVKA